MNEFQTYIRGIYGDTPLDLKTMMQLWNVWKTNPQAIINAYNLKNLPKKADYLTPKFGIEMPVPTLINLNNKPVEKKLVEKKEPVIEIGEPLAEGTGLLASDIHYMKNGILKLVYRLYYDENGNKMLDIINFLNPKNVYGEVKKGNNYFYVGHKTYNDYEDGSVARYKPIKPKTKVTYFRKHQQGGTMNNQQELQKAFMAYLIQDAQAQGIQLQSEQDLLAYAEQLGEEGIKAKYQEFILKMQGGVMARLGAKLEYYKKLKGVCPEGEELVYFKQGGRICKACQKSQNGTKVTKKANEVDKFKAERALYKKDMKSAGYALKDACGSKMKVNKCGSKMKTSKGCSKKK